MKLILAVFLSFLFLECTAYYTFQCYAGPLVYGPWKSSGHGIIGNDTVTFKFQPIGSTQIYCQMNCCNNISPPGLDEISCKWDCAGEPSIHCYGSPTGSVVKVYQYS